jgi:DNA-binding MarR family transcriptional regulator
MKTVRDLKDQAKELHDLVIELGRVRSLRDPLGDIGEDLSPPQRHILFWLGIDHEMPSSVLAQRCGCSSPSLSGLVDRLEKMGLVERARRDDDRRVVTVRLTEQGRALHERIHKVIEHKLESFLGFLNERDRKSLLGIVRRLVKSRTDAATTTDLPDSL